MFENIIWYGVNANSADITVTSCVSLLCVCVRVQGVLYIGLFFVFRLLGSCVQSCAQKSEGMLDCMLGALTKSSTLPTTEEAYVHSSLMQMCTILRSLVGLVCVFIQGIYLHNCRARSNELNR